MIDDDRAAEAVRNAVALGYRHIDTAEAYGNEQGVGEGIRNYGEAAIFPVYGGKMNSDGTYTARYFYKGAEVSKNKQHIICRFQCKTLTLQPNFKRNNKIMTQNINTLNAILRLHYADGSDKVCL